VKDEAFTGDRQEVPGQVTDPLELPGDSSRNNPARNNGGTGHDIRGEAPPHWRSDGAGISEDQLEGEIYGVGMFEEMAKKYPEHADKATAVATMEWLNVHLAEDFGHAAGLSVSLKQAEKLGRDGTEMVRKHSFEHVAKECMKETPAADKLYEEMGKHTRNPELKAFADDLMVHEPALRDWLKSELDQNSDGAERSSPISNATGSAEKKR
jgi:hypothetical protein